MHQSLRRLRYALQVLLGTMVLGSTGAQAHAWGQFSLVGATITSPMRLDGQRVPFNGFRGPTLELGYEFGERVNQQLSFFLAYVEGRGLAAGHPIMLRQDVLAGGYHLTFDVWGKKGFSPYLGGGILFGMSRLLVETQKPYPTHLSETGRYLDLRAVVGLRYTWESGIGMRAQVAYGTGNGFPGWQPSLGVALQF
jgi:hypothetical protein